MLNTKPTPLRFPQDTLRFLYWVFFKPITLHNYLYDIDDSLRSSNDPNLLMLWRRRKEHPEFIPVIWLSLLNIFIMPLLAFPLVWVFQLAGFEVDWSNMVFWVVFTVLSGVAFSAVVGGGTTGVVYAVGGGVTFVVVFGVEGKGSSEIGVVAGAAFGMVWGMAACIQYGFSMWMLTGVLLGVVFGVVFGVIESVAVGVAVGVAIILGYYRVILYIFELPLALLVTRLYRMGGLHHHPFVWDEMIWFPLLGLDRLLVKITLEERQRGLDAIADVASSYRQGWAARKALLTLTVRDIRQADSLEKIGTIESSLAISGSFAKDDMREIVSSIERISQHALAVQESETLFNQQEQLRMGLGQTERLIQVVSSTDSDDFRDFPRELIPALNHWKTVFQHQLENANQHKNIPNVYVSGSPLRKESKVFKGRRDLFKDLGNELVTPAGQRPTILLFGARRMGKTSTLKQLPVQLGPQIVPVAVDLQKASTVESAVGLLYLIARDITKSAARERSLAFPELTKDELKKDPYLAFQEWLDKVNEKLSDYYWVLLALDEFESLGGMLEDKRVDKRIFQLLRGIIQHHPRITILMSGAHTLEELPPLWSNYFINTNMLKVGPLDKSDAIELIIHPIPDFPLEYDEDALDLMLDETGCHPNWLQFTCREVVEKLNDEDRFHAVREDVEWAIARVPQVLAGDFKDMWEGRDSSPLMRDILKVVAKEEVISVDKLDKLKKNSAEFQKTLDFILRRDILIFEEDTYRFRSGLLRRWVSKQL